MNDKPFEDALRAAMPAPPEPPTLDAKIDRALDMQNHARPATRRLAFGFALTAAVAAALVAIPAAPAEAGVAGILDALARTPHVRIEERAPDAKGVWRTVQTTDVANGARHVYDNAGTRDAVEVGDRSYAFDRLLNAYVSRPRFGSAPLNVTVVPLSGKTNDPDQEASVERRTVDGATVLIATVTDKRRDLRYVVNADPDTKLPLTMFRMVRDRAGWRTVGETRFRYNVPVQIALPDLKGRPPLTPAEADAAYRRVLTGDPLAELPLQKGALLVRRLDVAQDGTVYVAFQSGKQGPRTFAGYTLRLTDDLGTEYLRVGGTYERTFDKAPSLDGKFEMEVFAPRTPVPGAKPRTLRLQAHRFENGAWAGTVEQTVHRPDGGSERLPSILSTSEGQGEARPADLLSRRFSAPTCAEAPAWAALFSEGDFGSKPLIDLTKTTARAVRALEDRRWPEAKALLKEEARLEAETTGSSHLGPRPGETQKNLAEVEKEMSSARP